MKTYHEQEEEDDMNSTIVTDDGIEFFDLFGDCQTFKLTEEGWMYYSEDSGWWSVEELRPFEVE